MEFGVQVLSDIPKALAKEGIKEYNKSNKK